MLSAASGLPRGPSTGLAPAPAPGPEPHTITSDTHSIAPSARSAPRSISSQLVPARPESDALPDQPSPRRSQSVASRPPTLSVQRTSAASGHARTASDTTPRASVRNLPNPPAPAEGGPGPHSLLRPIDTSLPLAAQPSEIVSGDERFSGFRSHIGHSAETVPSSATPAINSPAPLPLAPTAPPFSPTASPGSAGWSNQAAHDSARNVLTAFKTTIAEADSYIYFYEHKIQLGQQAIKLERQLLDRQANSDSKIDKLAFGWQKPSTILPPVLRTPGATALSTPGTMTPDGSRSPDAEQPAQTVRETWTELRRHDVAEIRERVECLQALRAEVVAPWKAFRDEQERIRRRIKGDLNLSMGRYEDAVNVGLRKAQGAYGNKCREVENIRRQLLELEQGGGRKKPLPLLPGQLGHNPIPPAIPYKAALSRLGTLRNKLNPGANGTFALEREPVGLAHSPQEAPSAPPGKMDHQLHMAIMNMADTGYPLSAGVEKQSQPMSNEHSSVPSHHDSVVGSAHGADISIPDEPFAATSMMRDSTAAQSKSKLGLSRAVSAASAGMAGIGAGLWGKTKGDKEPNVQQGRYPQFNGASSSSSAGGAAPMAGAEAVPPLPPDGQDLTPQASVADAASIRSSAPSVQTSVQTFSTAPAQPLRPGQEGELFHQLADTAAPNFTAGSTREDPLSGDPSIGYTPTGGIMGGPAGENHLRAQALNAKLDKAEEEDERLDAAYRTMVFESETLRVDQVKKLQAALNTSVASRKELATLVQQTSVAMARRQLRLHERLAAIQHVALDDASHATNSLDQEMDRFRYALPTERQVNANPDTVYDNFWYGHCKDLLFGFDLTDYVFNRKKKLGASNADAVSTSPPLIVSKIIEWVEGGCGRWAIPPGKQWELYVFGNAPHDAVQDLARAMEQDESAFSFATREDPPRAVTALLQFYLTQLPSAPLPIPWVKRTQHTINMSQNPVEGWARLSRWIRQKPLINQVTLKAVVLHLARLASVADAGPSQATSDLAHVFAPLCLSNNRSLEAGADVAAALDVDLTMADLIANHERILPPDPVEGLSRAEEDQAEIKFEALPLLSSRSVEEVELEQPLDDQQRADRGLTPPAFGTSPSESAHSTYDTAVSHTPPTTGQEEDEEQTTPSLQSLSRFESPSQQPEANSEQDKPEDDLPTPPVGTPAERESPSLPPIPTSPKEVNAHTVQHAGSPLTLLQSQGPQRESLVFEPPASGPQFETDEEDEDAPYRGLSFPLHASSMRSVTTPHAKDPPTSQAPTEHQGEGTRSATASLSEWGTTSSRAQSQRRPPGHVQDRMVPTVGEERAAHRESTKGSPQTVLTDPYADADDDQTFPEPSPRLGRKTSLAPSVRSEQNEHGKGAQPDKTVTLPGAAEEHSRRGSIRTSLLSDAQRRSSVASSHRHFPSSARRSVRSVSGDVSAPSPLGASENPSALSQKA